MGQIKLNGFLICRTMAEADRVATLLAEHIRLTRAEPGCIVFEVIRSMSDPMRFALHEIFASRADFSAHQARTRASLWWRATRHIPRDYILTDSDGETPYHPASEADAAP